MLLLTRGCIVNKKLEENKSIIRDILGKNITRSEIIDLYRTIQECDIGKETFVRYLMGIIGHGDPRFPDHYQMVEL